MIINELLALEGFITDITALVQANEALLASEKRFISIIEQASYAIFIQDYEGNIIEANDKACENLGYTRDELLSMTTGNFDESYNDIEYRENIMHKLQKGNTTVIESNLKRKNGTTYPV